MPQLQASPSSRRKVNRFFTRFDAIVKRAAAFSCSDIAQLLSPSVWRKFGQ
jgi:hypothetical protein